MPSSEVESVRFRSSKNNAPEYVDGAVESVAAPSQGRWVRFLAAAALYVLLAPILFGLGMWLQYEYLGKPSTLKSAGPIHVAEMSTEVSPDSILPTAAGSDNAASSYVLALNNYN